MNWTESYLKTLKKQGKIRGYEIMKRPKDGRIVSKHFKKKSKEKDWISLNILYWCNEHALQLQEEYKFHPVRKWRFDWCVPSIKVAIEYNGIMSAKSRHTTITGYNGDMNKLNAAQKLGWTVLQFTPLNYQNLINDLNEYYKQINNERNKI